MTHEIHVVTMEAWFMRGDDARSEYYFHTRAADEDHQSSSGAHQNDRSCPETVSTSFSGCSESTRGVLARDGMMFSEVACERAKEPLESVFCGGCSMSGGSAPRPLVRWREASILVGSWKKDLKGNTLPMARWARTRIQ